jgi:hypothetical protein
MFCRYLLGGRNSSVGIVTGNGLDSPGIETWWERVFSHSSRLVPGATQPPVQWVPVIYREWSGQDVVLTTHPLLKPRSRKSTAMYIYLPMGLRFHYGAPSLLDTFVTHLIFFIRVHSISILVKM